MNQEVIWVEVIQFLEPIDILSSLLTLDRTLYSLFEKCVVPLDDISDYCFHGSLNVRILISNDDSRNELSQCSETIPLLGNCRYFVNLYLLKLAFKLGNINPGKKVNDFETIIDESQFKLLRFYRSVLSSNSVEKDVVHEYHIKYAPTGEYSIGKSTFFNHVEFGRYQNTSLFKSDAIKKDFTMPNESILSHLIFDVMDPRYQTKESLITSLIQHKLSFLLSFAIDYECTFEKLSDWFRIITQENLETMDIMIGLHPHRKPNFQYKKVIPKEVIRKAFYEFGKLLIVEVDMGNNKNVFVPFWFFQLQYTYFKDLKDLQYVVRNKDIQSSSSSPMNCFIC